MFLTSVAMVGTQTSDLGEQLAQALAFRPDVCADDHRRQRRHPQGAARTVGRAAFSEAVTAMREAGAEVVVGTCPDLGTIRPIAPPAAPGRPPLEPAARGRPGDRRGRGGRSGGVARHDPRTGVRRRARRHVRPRPLPPVGRTATAAAPARCCRPSRSHSASRSSPTEAHASRIDHAAVTAASHTGTEISATEVDSDSTGPPGPTASAAAGPFCAVVRVLTSPPQPRSRLISTGPTTPRGTTRSTSSRAAPTSPLNAACPRTGSVAA